MVDTKDILVTKNQKNLDTQPSGKLISDKLTDRKTETVERRERVGYRPRQKKKKALRIVSGELYFPCFARAFTSLFVRFVKLLIRPAPTVVYLLPLA